MIKSTTIYRLHFHQVVSFFQSLIGLIEQLIQTLVVAVLSNEVTVLWFKN